METQKKEAVEINLQDLFVMNNEYFVMFLKERCFDRLNEFLKEKSGAISDPLFAHETENFDVKIGYVPLNNGGTKFFSDQTLTSIGDDTKSRAILTQYVIYHACKEYGCHREVKMHGAPEETTESYFTYTHQGITYKYMIWKQRR